MRERCGSRWRSGMELEAVVGLVGRLVYLAEQLVVLVDAAAAAVAKNMYQTTPAESLFKQISLMNCYAVFSLLISIE